MGTRSFDQLSNMKASHHLKRVWEATVWGECGVRPFFSRAASLGGHLVSVRGILDVRDGKVPLGSI